MSKPKPLPEHALKVLNDLHQSALQDSNIAKSSFTTGRLLGVASLLMCDVSSHHAQLIKAIRDCTNSLKVSLEVQLVVVPVVDAVVTHLREEAKKALSNA